MTEPSAAAPASAVDPRLRVLYLALVAVGVFLLPTLGWVAAVTGLQIALWFAVRLPVRRLLRQLKKLGLIAAVILLSYGLTSQDPASDHWITLDLFGWSIDWNTAGGLRGLTMVLRILAVVLASQVARSGNPRAVAQGLSQLGLPPMASVSIDTVLALFGTTGRKPRNGRASGAGKGGATAAVSDGEGFWQSVRRLSRGDVGPIMGRLQRQIADAEAYAVTALGPSGRALAGDIGVIAGVSLTMLGIKALKVLPSIPFAPGHKGVILLPLYVVAARLTRTRLGATLTGLTMGAVAFLMGDGRYGVFEIVKHVAPGVFCDALVPLLLAGGRRPGPVVWSLFGALLAIARFGTIFCITLLVQAPKVAYAFLLPGLTIHTVFGVASGYVSYHLMNALDRRDDRQPPARPPETA